MNKLSRRTKGDILSIIPAGTVLPFAGENAPQGWLLCDGSPISRTLHPELFEAIGTAHGIGDGTTTFNLPDLRGRFVRGVDGTAGRDPDKLTRSAVNGGNSANSVGSVQDDALQNITGEFGAWTRTSGGNGAFQTPTASAGNTSNTGNVTISNNGPTTNFDASRVARTSSESRGKNINLNHIIKT